MKKIQISEINFNLGLYLFYLLEMKNGFFIILLFILKILFSFFIHSPNPI